MCIGDKFDKQGLFRTLSARIFPPTRSMDSHEDFDQRLDHRLIDIAENEGMGTARLLAALALIGETDKTAGLISEVIVEKEEGEGVEVE